MGSSNPLSRHKCATASGALMVGYCLFAAIGYFRGRKVRWREALPIATISATFTLIAELTPWQKGGGGSLKPIEFAEGSAEAVQLEELLGQPDSDGVAAFMKEREAAFLSHGKENRGPKAILQAAVQKTAIEDLPKLIDGFVGDYFHLYALPIMQGCSHEPAKGLAVLRHLFAKAEAGGRKAGLAKGYANEAGSAMMKHIDRFAPLLAQDGNRELLENLTSRIPYRDFDTHLANLIREIKQANPNALVWIAHATDSISIKYIVEQAPPEQKAAIFKECLGDLQENKAKIKTLLPHYELSGVIDKEPFNHLGFLTPLLAFDRALNDHQLEFVKEQVKAALARLDGLDSISEADQIKPEHAPLFVTTIGCTEPLSRYIMQLQADSPLVEALLAALFEQSLKEKRPLAQIPLIDSLFEKLATAKLASPETWTPSLQKHLDSDDVDLTGLGNLGALAGRVGLTLPSNAEDPALLLAFNQLKDEKAVREHVAGVKSLKTLRMYLQQGEQAQVEWLISVAGLEQLKGMLPGCEELPDRLSWLLALLDDKVQTARGDIVFEWIFNTSKAIPHLGETEIGRVLKRLKPKKREEYESFAKGVIEGGHPEQIKWLVLASNPNQISDLLCLCKDNFERKSSIISAIFDGEVDSDKLHSVALHLASDEEARDLSALLREPFMQHPLNVSRLNYASHWDWKRVHKGLLGDKMVDLLGHLFDAGQEPDLSAMNLFGKEEMSAFPVRAAADPNFVSYILALKERPDLHKEYCAALVALLSHTYEREFNGTWVQPPSFLGITPAGYYTEWPTPRLVNPRLDEIIGLLETDYLEELLAKPNASSWREQIYQRSNMVKEEDPVLSRRLKAIDERICKYASSRN